MSNDVSFSGDELNLIGEALAIAAARLRTHAVEARREVADETEQQIAFAEARYNRLRDKARACETILARMAKAGAL